MPFLLCLAYIYKRLPASIKSGPDRKNIMVEMSEWDKGLGSAGQLGRNLGSGNRMGRELRENCLEKGVREMSNK